ncbi:MerR family transcriptional regulator [Deinococcus hopiensis]|uniref:DNA-binding transcriptional regulator, MerR family n=1 Tax=Deinococcus hopiensis KR-140 TaxID=695939 RepID=A0A1W1VWH1_9DEIO|nr:MerR family transcriptional regulator [Deinococcus hopiensis]SMB97600.1 DNA-binding transcriptional regulator, MerR family [Deinococcus hopiensis KR-140]
MRIGQLAKAAGVSVRAIRHYDSLGLLTSAREDNRYRTFQVDDVERVQLIQLFLKAGFKLEEIRERVPCFRYGHTSLDAPAGEVRALYALKIADVEAQIAVLQRLRDKLLAGAQRLEAQTHHSPVRFRG